MGKHRKPRRATPWVAAGIGVLAVSLGTAGAIHFGTTSATVASVPEAADADGQVLEVAGLAEEQGREREAVSLEKYNALSSAQDYVERMAVSQKTLTDYLKESDYSRSAIRYAKDNVTVDYSAEAIESAGLYMQAGEMTPELLRKQLKYEGFTSEQIASGVESAYGTEGA